MMFSQSCLQPQILNAVSELTSLINFPRICVSMPTRRQHAKSDTKIHVHSLPIEENTTLQDISQENEIFEHIPKDLSHRRICPLVSADCETGNTAVSKYCKEVQNRNNGLLWRERFVSTETFFQNKTGFSESQIKLQDKNDTGTSSYIQSKQLHRFLQSTAQHLFFQQNRGFKTSGLLNIKFNFNKADVAENLKNMGFTKAEKDDLMKIYFHPENIRVIILKNKILKKMIDDGKKSEEEIQNECKEFFLELLQEKNRMKEEGMKEDIFNMGLSLDEKKEIKRIFAQTQTEKGEIFKLLLKIVLLTAIVIYLGSSLSNISIEFEGLGEVNSNHSQVKFNAVKGVDEAKEELKDIVAYLKDPKKYSALGGNLPKGVLLVGPPGTGKTLLARAVAGEANVPFFYASGAEFDQMFVGIGTMKVRRLFAQAKHRAPCVIFIDEIDSVGTKRSTGGRPYDTNTLNQLLSEMDGFKQNKGIIVIGATNRPGDLDPALLRPGRFDIKVQVNLPDLKGRIEILNLYLRQVRTSTNINVHKIARGTTTFSGADLSNLVNTATLHAAKQGTHRVTMEDIEFAKDKIMMGPAKKNKLMDENQRWTTAYHEAGHTVVSYFTKGADPLHKVTILPRGQLLGATLILPEKDVYGFTKSQLLAKMDVFMGGRVGEEIIYGSDYITTGAANDFEKATNLAKGMVEQYGMSEKVGFRVFTSETRTSKEVRKIVDSEIARILQESYDRANNLLKKHSKQHKMLAEALMVYETLDSKDIKNIMEGRKIKLW